MKKTVLLFVLCFLFSCEKWNLDETSDVGLCDAINCGQHGTCDINTGLCVCDAGWMGQDCSVENPNDPCLSVDCGEHGTCNSATGLCTCDEGWTGENCTIEIVVGPCENVDCGLHGTCNSDTGICDCDTGWAGANCDSVSTFFLVLGSAQLDEMGYGITATSNNEFAIIGEKEGTGGFFLKIDADGNVLTTLDIPELNSIDRNYGNGPGTISPFGFIKIITLVDGRFAALGYTESGIEENISLVFIEPDGTTKTSFTYDIGEQERSNDLIQTNNGNLVITGSHRPIDVSINYEHGLFFTEISASGDLIESVFYPSIDEAIPAVGWAIRQKDNGIYVIGGSNNLNENGSFAAYIVNTNAEPSTMTEFLIGGEGYSNAFSMDKTSSGDFVSFGYELQNDDLDFRTVQFSVSSNNNAIAVSDEHTYGENNIDNVGNSVLVDQEDNIVFTGFNKESNIKRYVTFRKIIGSSIIQENYGNLDDVIIDRGWQIIESPDGGYVIVGMTETYSPNGSSDILVIKTDKNGKVYGPTMTPY